MQRSYNNYFLLGLLFISFNALAQLMPIQIFDSFVDKNWEGHYVGSEDSIYLHQIKWDYILDSMAVKETKIVAELNFEMETYYFMDWDLNLITFMTLMNREMTSSGVIMIEKTAIVLEGVNVFKNGSAKFRKTFEINCDGKLVDQFYQWNGDAWERRHIIEYWVGEEPDDI